MKKQKISSITLALLLFLTVFGISNVPTNFAALGNSAIGWFTLLAIYFIPLALIIAELASKNPDTRSGMSAWIGEGLGEKWAFIGAWSYFIANIFYIPMLASRIPVMLSWAFSAQIDSLQQVVDTSGNVPGVINASSNQGMFLVFAVVIVIIGLVLAVLFENIFEKAGKIIGWISLGVTALFLILALLSVLIGGHQVANPITLSNAMPILNKTSISTFAWILFAIAGIETIGSYVGLTDDAQTKIPRAIMYAAVLIIGAYIIGFIAMAFILTPDQIPVDNLENMTQIMYAQVFNMWGFGPWVLRIIMLIYSLITITALVLWTTSTVTVVFENFPEGILSTKVRDAKINGLPVFGLIFTGAMMILFVIISNTGGSKNIYTTLYDMSTIAVVLPYVLISLSYVVYKVRTDDAPFKMVKNKNIALILSSLVLVVTATAIVFACYDLTIPEMTDRIGWLTTSLGGLSFFLIIGVAIYYMKENIDVSFAILIIMFGVGGFVFSKSLYIVSVFFIGYYILRREALNQRKQDLLHK